MAAVYTVNGGRIETNVEELSVENKQPGVKKTVVSPLPMNSKIIKVEQSSEDEDSSNAEPTPTKRRPETAVMDAAPAIAIKEERIEEDEYVQIKLVDVDESLERTPNKESNRDNESVDVKLRSMRCQDCGQQFIRWEAFKIHLRQHEHEEEEQKIKKLKKKPPNQEGKKMKKAGAGLDRDNKGEGGDDDVNDDETWFSSGWELNPSEVFKVRPRVAMLSEEERPVYGPSHKVYACSVCGKVYSYLESFKNHQKMHLEKLPPPELFTCPECGRTFQRQANLIVHLKTHNKPIVPENYKCDQCNKIFNSQQTWMAHKVIHTRKPYWCLSCAKGFKEAKGLDRHLLGHDLKRHKCDLCPKAFRVPAELRYHRNTHTGAKPYVCQMCKKTFSQLGNLITHRKKHVGVYKEGSETPIGGKPQSGNRRVTELKKLIVMAMDDVDMAEEEESTEPEEEVVEREESEAEFEEEEVEEAEAEVVEKEEGALKCFECGSWFSQESELHLHYMKHASGQL
ncbi:zinc finger protein 184 isoform X2 [Anguilla anguilla]|uniref:zinc finger protein 184 isoform X2 n=1 Tax=Anguilla anguilla TaxID=7936 RepID=UPI0015AEDDE1|nr:zinc finger protein 184 isoform X2 [Anguilla anguilla]